MLFLFDYYFYYNFFFLSGHNKLSLYGRGKTWVRGDIERLLRKLTIEEYLMEDLVVTRDDITCAYIKVGSKAKDLFSAQCKVCMGFCFQIISF